MKSIPTSYSCFSEKGECPLPPQEFIDECLKDGIEPVIFLDSCVCLHIIKVVDYGKDATNVDFSKIIALKEYLEKHPEIKINPFFALMELCNQTGVLDKQKLLDFKSRIDFFEQIPLKVFKKFKYDFFRDMFVFKDFSKLPDNALDAFYPILMNSYCALLKIRSIALGGVTKSKAESNINEFADWMIDELKIFRGAEYKLAMNIFGGNTNFRKMLGLDSKPKEVKKKILGTSWDMFHSKFTTSSFRLFEILQRNIYPYFLTSDSNLFKIFQNFSLHILKDGGGNFMSSFISTSDFNYPHFEDSFIDKNNEKLFNSFVDRRNQEYEFDRVKVDKMISELELVNGIL
ncbi:hypothetical protein [Epilithonimonas xixisoli]|uniref:Uncharacterized protein n=1 Tax=Epilithonimonas xixisoli TaxID=1476462 RepID=A0A4V3H320_9FLAO|nr:hypothetical protein [Epilithonimonas xixisoli]TDX87311.1 hypothetical protein B0I22_1499 [Epilithonimonas xixisoli]